VLWDVFLCVAISALFVSENSNGWCRHDNTYLCLKAINHQPPQPEWQLDLMITHQQSYSTLSSVSTRWVAICQYALLLCNQPPRPTQPPAFIGIGNEYWPRGSVVLFVRGRNCVSDVTLWCVHLRAGSPQKGWWVVLLCTSVEHSILYLQPTTTLTWVPCCTCRRRWLLSAVSAAMAVADWMQSRCYSRVPWTRLQAVEYRSMYRTCHSFRSFLAKSGTLHSHLCVFLIVWSVSFLFLSLVLFMVALWNRADHYIFILWSLSIFYQSSFFPA